MTGDRETGDGTGPGTRETGRIETRAIHAGQEPDPETGALMTPIYANSTYRQSAPGDHTGYEYSRTGNPTRTDLEANLASLEGGAHGLEDLHSVHPGHHNVEQDKVGILLPGDIYALLSTGGLKHFVALFFEVVLDQFEEVLFVVNY